MGGLGDRHRGVTPIDHLGVARPTSCISRGVVWRSAGERWSPRRRDSSVRPGTGPVHHGGDDQQRPHRPLACEIRSGEGIFGATANHPIRRAVDAHRRLRSRSLRTAAFAGRVEDLCRGPAEWVFAACPGARRQRPRPSRPAKPPHLAELQAGRRAVPAARGIGQGTTGGLGRHGRSRRPPSPCKPSGWRCERSSLAVGWRRPNPRLGCRRSKVPASQRPDSAPARRPSRPAKATRVLLANRRVLVSLDKATGTWDATWLDGATAAVHGVGFAVEVDGRQLTPPAVKAEAAPLTDPLGSGLELRRRWGTRGRNRTAAAAVPRPGRRRGRGGIFTNQHRSRCDLEHGGERLIECLSEAGRGWWHLGRTDVRPPGGGWLSRACRPAVRHRTKRPWLRPPSSTTAAPACWRWPSGNRPPDWRSALLLSRRRAIPSVHAPLQAGRGRYVPGGRLTPCRWGDGWTESRPDAGAGHRLADRQRAEPSGPGALRRRRGRA